MNTFDLGAAWLFNDGLAAVNVSMAIKPQFDYVGAFSDGLALATLTPDGKSGYIDTTGRFVIEPQYDEAEDFSEGLAPVKKDGKWRFIW